MRAPLCFLLLTIALPALAVGNDSLILPGQRAGPVWLGKSATTVAQVWGPARRRLAQERVPDGGEPDYYYEYPEHGLWMLVRQGRILKIGLEAGPWRTREGLRLQVKAAEVRRAYGPGSIRRISGEDKGEPRYFLEYRSRGITFLVRQTDQVVEAIHVYPPGP